MGGDGEIKLGEVVDLTQATEEDDEAIPGSRHWLIVNVPQGQPVPWPTDLQEVKKMLNPDIISFANEEIREEKCKCVWSCELTKCADAVKAQVCEDETCSVGAKMCQNKFRTCRLQLRVTR